MLTLRRCVVGVLVVLLGGCSGPDAAFIADLQRAEQGDVDAQHMVASAYALGISGVQQNDWQAVAWYRRAAEQGDADAQFSLGTLYGYGKGVPQDDVQMVTWWRKAAEQGYADAQYNVGHAYGSGRGVPQDYVEAHKWRNLAASRASAKDRERYAEARDAVAKEMTPAQIATAQFSGTTVALPAAGGESQDVKVGGVRAGGGLRLRF